MRTICGTTLSAILLTAFCGGAFGAELSRPTGELQGKAQALAGLPPQANSSVTNAAAVMEAKTLVGRAGESLNYRFYAQERAKSGPRYPLVLFLHGAGERGDDNAMQLQWGVWPIVSYMKSKGIKFVGDRPLKRDRPLRPKKSEDDAMPPVNILQMA